MPGLLSTISHMRCGSRLTPTCDLRRSYTSHTFAPKGGSLRATGARPRYFAVAAGGVICAVRVASR